MILKNEFLELEINEEKGGDITCLISLEGSRKRNLLDRRGMQIWLKAGDNRDPNTEVISTFYSDFRNRHYTVESSCEHYAKLQCTDGKIKFTKTIALQRNRIVISTEVENLSDTESNLLQIEYHNTFTGGTLKERKYVTTIVSDGSGNCSTLKSEEFGQRFVKAFQYDHTKIQIQYENLGKTLAMTADSKTECATVMVQANILMRGFNSNKFTLASGEKFTHSIELAVEKESSSCTGAEKADSPQWKREARRKIADYFVGEPVFAERWSHLTFQYDKVDVDDVKKVIAELLAPMRYNGIIFEFNRGLRTKSHPELAASWALDTEEARELVEFARSLGFKIGVQFNSPGHQNETMIPEVYPELIEKEFALCVSNDKAFSIVSSIIKEYIESFQPDLVHFGADEVQKDGVGCNFGHCPLCRNKKPYELFADYLSRLNDLVPSGIRRSLWGDMFLQHKQFGDRVWGNGSAGEVWRAIDLIPKEIEILDWHYFGADSYKSIDYFQERGFNVWAATAFNLEGIRQFTKYAEEKKLDRILHTTWAVPNQESLPIESMVWAAFYNWLGKAADELPVYEAALDFSRKFWK